MGGVVPEWRASVIVMSLRTRIVAVASVAALAAVPLPTGASALAGSGPLAGAGAEDDRPRYRAVGAYSRAVCHEKGAAGVSRGEWADYYCKIIPLHPLRWFTLYVTP